MKIIIIIKNLIIIHYTFVQCVIKSIKKPSSEENIRLNQNNHIPRVEDGNSAKTTEKIEQYQNQIRKKNNNGRIDFRQIFYVIDRIAGRREPIKMRSMDQRGDKRDGKNTEVKKE